MRRKCCLGQYCLKWDKKGRLIEIYRVLLHTWEVCPKIGQLKTFFGNLKVTKTDNICRYDM